MLGSLYSPEEHWESLTTLASDILRMLESKSNCLKTLNHLLNVCGNREEK